MEIPGSIHEKMEKRAVIISFVLSLIIGGLITAGIYVRADAAEQRRLQEHLASEVLRFHVLANSDSREDQELKLKVRDAVLDYMEINMPETDSAKQSEEWIRKYIDEIEMTGQDVIRENGADYPVSAAVTTCWFPDKSYGDVTFPAGNYEALRIEIGEAEGHNWWCVLYPGLCFMDAANAVVPDEGKQKLKNILTEEEYSRITADSDFRISWFFWKK